MMHRLEFCERHWRAILFGVVLLAASAQGTAFAAISVTGPATLGTPGATYLLANDFSCAGTAFTITATNVTLDLGGHTVTYATAGTGCGVEGSNWNGWTVRNGTLQLQVGQTARGCTAIHGNSSSNCTVSAVTVDTSAADTNRCVYFTYGSGNVVTGCTLSAKPLANVVTIEACNTCEVAGNIITLKAGTASGSHCAGIYVSCPSPSASGGNVIRDNAVMVEGQAGTVSRHGIWLAIWARYTEVRGNSVSNANDESRGIHVDCASDYSHVDNNAVATSGYHTRGIRVRDVQNCEIDHNVIMTVGAGGTGIEVGRNDAIYNGCAHNAIHDNAVDVSGAGTAAIALQEQAAHTTLKGNRLTSNYRGLVISDAYDNASTADTFATGPSPSGYADVGIASSVGYTWSAPATGNTVTDPVKASAMVWSFGGAASGWDLALQWTATATVKDALGNPVANATWTIRDNRGTTVCSAVTDTSGRAAWPCVQWVRTSTAGTTTETPHSFAASKAGCPDATTQRTMASPQTFDMVLGGATAPPAVIPPPAVSPGDSQTVVGDPQPPVTASDTDPGSDLLSYWANDLRLPDDEMAPPPLSSPAPDEPVVAPIGNQTVAEGAYLTFVVSATAPNGDPATCWPTGLPSGATFDQATKRFSWVPAYGQAGTYRLTFIVTHGGGMVSQTITITVTHTNCAASP